MSAVLSSPSGQGFVGMSPLPQTRALVVEGEGVVGEFVGNEVGASVGLENGGVVITTGALVGREVVGLAVVGELVGLLEGAEMGDELGAVVGLFVGCAVGGLVGLVEGDEVGCRWKEQE